LSDSPLFFPAGLEKVFLAIYSISIPYIVGLMFLYFYVAHAKTETFLALSESSSFFMTWAIGYEMIAVLSILWFVKSAITFSIKASKNKTKQGFRRPV
jgi:hypothetical protein